MFVVECRDIVFLVDFARPRLSTWPKFAVEAVAILFRGVLVVVGFTGGAWLSAGRGAGDVWRSSILELGRFSFSVGCAHIAE